MSDPRPQSLPDEFIEPLARAAARLGPFARQILWYQDVPSTNDLAAALAERGAREGCVVVANGQSAGRGRQGRSWASPPGAGLYVSTVLRPAEHTLRLLTIAAGVLFWTGWFGAGLLCGWAMTFLDTVDGKLARVTMTSSRIGHVLDHGLDIVHPPIWYLLWGMGLHSGDYATSQSLYAATLIVVVGYLVGRALEGAFILRFKFEMHCWRPIDSLFRTISARRNPNLILLSVATLGGRPDLGLVMVAIWTVVSIGFHLERLVQALVERSKGAEIVCWHEAQIATAEGPEAHVGAVR